MKPRGIVLVDSGLRNDWNSDCGIYAISRRRKMIQVMKVGRAAMVVKLRLQNI